MKFTVLPLTEFKKTVDNSSGYLRDSLVHPGVSDLSIALGATVAPGFYSEYQYPSSYNLAGFRIGSIWLNGDKAEAYVLDESSFIRSEDVTFRGVSTRPALLLNSARPPRIQLGDSLGHVRIKDFSPCLTFEFGEYPQKIVPSNISRELERCFRNNLLKKTGKDYTFDAVDPYRSSTSRKRPFVPCKHPEYILDGKKYVRVHFRPQDCGTALSTGKVPQEGEACWFEVRRCAWEEAGKYLVSKMALFAGINWESVPSYLNAYFAKELIPSDPTLAPEKMLLKGKSRNDIIKLYTRKNPKIWE